MNMYKFLLSFLLANLLPGCGFHLAGEGSFAKELNNTHIQNVSSGNEMSHLIEKNLRSSQINIVAKESATALLRILSVESEKEVITVDSDGKAREFELILKITFEVKRPDNSALLDKQIIALNRDFVFDKNNLLGTNEEERELLNEMRKDAAKLIVYRLQTI